jgi:hypothetical protein
LLSAGDQEIVQDLTIGSRRYAKDPWLGLPFDENGLVVAVPVLGSGGFVSGLYVGGFWFADCSNGCSFGVFDSAEGTAQKTEGVK